MLLRPTCCITFKHHQPNISGYFKLYFRIP